MCRAMPEQDLVVELLHYDPDGYRLDASRSGTASAVVEAVEPLTHDITRLELRCEPEFAFTPGQYVDLWVPGAEPRVRRSFSMANLPGDGRIELIIKRYPGGRLSGMLDGQIRRGDRLGFTGPYGAFRLRERERPILMIAGGSGMAPILSLLRELSAEGCSRPVRFFYGARTARDLFWLDEIERIGSALDDFRFTPVVDSFVHDAVTSGSAAGEVRDPDVYMCGPPPMIEAAEEMLDRHATRSTSSGSSPTSSRPRPMRVTAGRRRHRPVATRDFSWFAPAGRHATLYEDVTIDTQPSVHRHLRRGWPVSFEDGRGTWNDELDRAALRRLVRVPRPRRAVGAAVLPGGQRERAADRRGDALGRRRRAARRLQPGVGASSCARFSRSRHTSSTVCGSRSRRSRATACRTRSPPACACRRR